VRLYNKIARSSPFRGSFPFSSDKPTGCVLAYEIEWGHIVGIDYRNPLCEVRLWLLAHNARVMGGY
jgi:hypothetical protein